MFDGFDEYVLRNKGAVSPIDVLESLSSMSSETGARVVLTSRISFWENIPAEERAAFIGRTRSIEYEIIPFDLNTATNYFSNCFQKSVISGERSKSTRGLVLAKMRYLVVVCTQPGS